MSIMIKVGMADLKVAAFPDNLTTLGLGSCIGICIYDPSTKIAGMAHIMLPSSDAIKQNSNIAKFADTAIVQLVKEMEQKGAPRARFFPKIPGGPQMFAFASSSETMRIGERNAESVRKILKSLSIPIKVDETGGSVGRTIEFYSDSGRLLIKTAGSPIKEL